MSDLDGFWNWILDSRDNVTNTQRSISTDIDASRPILLQQDNNADVHQNLNPIYPIDTVNDAQRVPFLQPQNQFAAGVQTAQGLAEPITLQQRSAYSLSRPLNTPSWMDAPGILDMMSLFQEQDTVA